MLIIISEGCVLKCNGMNVVRVTYVLLLLCRCIMKMDHHCRILCANILSRNELKWQWNTGFSLNASPPAWLNNCVGHFNHRYFFSFCLFMTLGCVYCSISGRNLFLDAYHALEVSPLVCWGSWVLCPTGFILDLVLTILASSSLTLGSVSGCCPISALNTWMWKSQGFQ